jgi:predicted phosphodiesterase
MKLLLLSDVEEKGLWDYWTPGKTDAYDLIISCGDLSADYLEYLTTAANKPLLYVRGNHDHHYDVHPPMGCIDIDDTVYNFHGLRILGLGGSMRYHSGKDMYTEKQMSKRIRHMEGMLRFTGGFDLLVSHAPCLGYGDGEDLAHRGFACFNDLLTRWGPKYMAYGHVHASYGAPFKREIIHPAGTKLINAYDRYSLDLSEDDYPKEGQTGSLFYDLYIRRTHHLSSRSR